MEQTLINVGRAILILLGTAVSLSLVAWILVIGAYIVYVVKER